MIGVVFRTGVWSCRALVSQLAWDSPQHISKNMDKQKHQGDTSIWDGHDKLSLSYILTVSGLRTVFT